MSSNNPHLGYEIHDILVANGLETPSHFSTKVDVDKAQSHIEYHIGCIMTHLHLQIADDSLRDTPRRVAKMYCQEIFQGLDYENFPSCTTVENKMGYDELVRVRCTVKSMCEHHFVPFLGVADVAYIPRNRVLGLSKFNRVVDFFSRRPQIQERLTEQVAASLEHILETDDVAVVIKAKHLCVELRGVQDIQASTTTSKMLGRFRSDSALRAEFLSLCGGK